MVKHNVTRRLAKIIHDMEQWRSSMRTRQMPSSSVTKDDGSAVSVADVASDASDALNISEANSVGIGGLSDVSSSTTVEFTNLPSRLAIPSASSGSSFELAVYSSEKVNEALEAAQQAIEEAAEAKTTSNGKNSRRRGQTQPEPPPGGWVQGDQWVVDNAEGKPVEVRVWNGNEFVPEQVLASELLILSSGGVVRLADGVVTADAVAADAIDGMVITGATVRTAASGSRVQLDSAGLRTFNSLGEVTSTLASESSGLSIDSVYGTVNISSDDRAGQLFMQNKKSRTDPLYTNAGMMVMDTYSADGNVSIATVTARVGRDLRALEIGMGVYQREDETNSRAEIFTTATHLNFNAYKVAHNDIDIAPVGLIQMYPGYVEPDGWFICDGSELSRTEYVRLFALLGTSWGAGNGSTTFNIPDLRGRVPVGYDVTQTEFNAMGKRGGAKTHTLTTSQMPVHRHDPPGGSKYVGIDGTGGTAYGSVSAGSQLRWNWTQLDAGGGQPHNNLQPYGTINFIIKAR